LKFVLLKLDEDFHSKLKSRAVLEKKTLAKLCQEALEDFMAVPEQRVV
jgi:hypothetical protein